MAGFIPILPQNFQPNWLSSCVFWARSDLGITVTSGKVSQWNDSSGGGDANKNLTQSTVASRPTYIATNSNYNHYPTLSFTYTDPDFMISGTWATSLAQPCTIFLVGDSQGDAATAGTFVDGLINGKILVVVNSTPLIEVSAGHAFLWNPCNFALTSPNVLSIALNGITNTSIYQNSPTAGFSGSSSASTQGVTGITIGTYAGGATNPLQGNIAEIIYFSTILSTSQVTEIFNYLGARYAITV